MSRLIQNINDENLKPITFDKEMIIKDIKDQLPEPWVWYTLGDCMYNESYTPHDLLIIRNKEVHENVLYERPFTSINRAIDSTYSIVLGIDIVDGLKHLIKTFDSSLKDTIVTASVEVSSSRDLFNILRDIDASEGGIRNV